MATPHLHTISSLIEEETLPLLVQQTSGIRLLLRKTVRLPYAVCQSLTASNSGGSLFLIPLDNKGFYGAVSRHDEPTQAYSTLSQIIQPSTSDSVEVLIDNVTPIRQYDDETKKFTSKVLLPGEVITIIQHKRCPLLNDASQSSLCCFGIRKLQTEDMVCIRDTFRHFHLDKYLVSRFFIVHRNEFQKMELGSAYTLQDITQYQSLPKVVCSVSQKQTARDELALPSVFRMIKVVSDRVTLAYSLFTSNHPKPEDLIEISSYSDELFAIAKSSKVTMDDIRDHQSLMTVRKAIPGKTIGYQDYEEITSKGSSFPPQLPERPSTLRLGQGQTHINRSSLYNSKNGLDKASAAGAHPLPQTVNLPTKSRTSILKKFSTMATMSKKRQAPSMTSILNKLHSKDDDNNNDIGDKPKSKKSLRGLEIVHILPDSAGAKEFDLSKPLFPPPKLASDHLASHSGVSSTATSDDHSVDHIDEFIHNHYDFLENHQDSPSSRYSGPPSDGSSQRLSSTYSKLVVRFTDTVAEASDKETASADYTPVKEDHTVSRRSLRESLIRISAVADSPTVTVGDTKLCDGQGSTGIRDPHISKADVGSRVAKLPASGEQRPINHLEELKSCVLAKEGKAVEKPRIESKEFRVLEKVQAEAKTDMVERPVTIMEELRRKFDAATSDIASRQNKEILNGIKKAPTLSHDADLYMSPVRSSAVIKLTG